MDKTSGDTRTLVLQLRDRIIQHIDAVNLQPGDRLPSEEQLALQFEISRPALREALKLLEQDHIINVAHGKGRFISSALAVQVDRPITTFEPVDILATRHGFVVADEIISLTKGISEPEAAEHLQLTGIDKVTCLERLWHQDGLSLVYGRAFISDANLSAAPSACYKPEIIISRFLQRACLSKATILAASLPASAPMDRGFSNFGPCLVLKELLFDAHGSPVASTVSYYRGSHFSFNLMRKS